MEGGISHTSNNSDTTIYPEITSDSTGKGLGLTKLSLSSDASVMATRTRVMSRMGQAAHVRTTQRRARARAAPPVTAETATNTRYGWRCKLWVKGPKPRRGPSWDEAAWLRQD